MSFPITCIPFSRFTMNLIVNYWVSTNSIAMFSNKFASSFRIGSIIITCPNAKVITFYYKVPIVSLFLFGSPS